MLKRLRAGPLATMAALLLAVVALAAPGRPVQPVRAINTPWLTVSGSQLKDPSGNRVILRGVSLVDISVANNRRSRNARALIDMATDNANGWYARVVRLPVYPDAIDFQPGWNANPDAYFNTHLNPAIQHCISKQIYCIIDWHYIKDYNSSAVDSATRAFWNYVAPKYKDVPNVIFELYNEPINPDSWSTWKTWAQPWVNIIRSHAPNNLILIGGPRWSQNVAEAATSPFAGNNLAYVAHIYPQHGGQSTWDAWFGNSSTRVPYFITEWGWQQGGANPTSGTTSGYGVPFSAYLDAKGVSWTAWVFDSNWQPIMFDGGWNLLGGESYMGQFTKDFLFRTRNDNLPGGDGPSPTATRPSATTPPGTTVVPTTPVPTTPDPNVALKVQYRAAETAASANQVKPHLQLVNNGASAVPLTELTVRYWYSKEGTAGEQYFCDYAIVGCGNVKGTFGSAGSMQYLEVGFTGGTLAANGQTGEIQNRFAKSDWSPYTQTGDYSFDAAKTAFADHDRVTLYRNGTLVWGTEPGDPPPATRTSTSTSRPSATASPTRTSTVRPDITPTGVPPSVTSTRTRTSTRTSTRTATSLLRNGSFETDADGNGRPDSWTGSNSVAASSFARSNTLRYAGSYSIRHMSTAEATYMVTQAVTGITAGTTYTFSGWTNIPNTADAFSYKLELVWRNASNTNIRIDLIRNYTAQTGGWNFVTSNRIAPDGATNVVVRMNVGGLSATIYSDAFNLRAAGSVLPSATQTVTRTPTPALDVNPFVGARGYVNPDYAAKVNAQAAATGGTLGAKMASVANYSTAVWLDSIGAITAGRGLAGHLDEALRQQQASGQPVVITLVIYNLPNRDCQDYYAQSELTVAEGGLARYKAEFIDPIVDLVADPRYGSLRIVTIVEPRSLPNLLTSATTTQKCAEVGESSAYIQGIQYALNRLAPLPNVYNYLDIAHSGRLAWDSLFNPAVTLYKNVVTGTTAGYDSVDGFITNVANYVPVEEPFLTNANQLIGGQPVRMTRFYDWTMYLDELDYATALRNALIAQGFPSSIGMLIDTSRNGWGGQVRPLAPSTSNDVARYVDESRIDRRTRRDLWCNQVGAGIGARPQASPLPGIDAYVWAKPPGESDGGSEQGVPAEPGRGYHPICDPNMLWPPSAGSAYPTGAMDNAPLQGEWFPAQFSQLVQNAYPAF